jgi:hypothetical protein
MKIVRWSAICDECNRKQPGSGMLIINTGERNNALDTCNIHKKERPSHGNYLKIRRVETDEEQIS